MHSFQESGHLNGRAGWDMTLPACLESSRHSVFHTFPTPHRIITATPIIR